MLISEAQMDSINLTYARLRLAIDERDAFRIEAQMFKTDLEEVKLERDGFKSGLANALKLYNNEKKAHALTVEEKDLKIEFLEQKKSPKLLDYLIGFLAGAAAAAVGFAVF